MVVTARLSDAYLVEVGLQEMGLLVRSQETRPELFLELLLPQNQLNLAIIVVHLSVVRVNLAIQVERNVVFNTLIGGTGERDILSRDLEIGIRLGNIGSLQVDIEVVALSVRGGGALRPRY